MGAARAPSHVRGDAAHDGVLRRAHRDGGVELVDATAHDVMPDRDEGPSIEQEVIRIDHTHDPRALSRSRSRPMPAVR